MTLQTSRRFRRNIETTGRLFRGFGSLAFFFGSAFLFRSHFIVSIVLFAVGAFLLFEALRGWCALRACGIRTRF